jgi:hypothetical protein
MATLAPRTASAPNALAASPTPAATPRYAAAGIVVIEMRVGRLREDLRAEEDVPSAYPWGEGDVARRAVILEVSADPGE